MNEQSFAPLRKLVAKPTLTKIAKRKSAIKKEPGAIKKEPEAIKKEPAASEEPPQITRASPAHAVCNLGFQTTRRITQLLRSGRPFLCVLIE
jgi:hypothetical protein